MPAERTQSTWLESSQPWVTLSRRASTAATSTVPVTACEAPATRCASAIPWVGRSSALLGMQAQ